MDITSMLALSTYSWILAGVGVVILVVAIVIKKRQA